VPDAARNGHDYSGTGVAFQGLYFYTIQAVVGPSTTADSNQVSGTPQPVPKRTEKVGSDHRLCGMGWAGEGRGLPWYGVLAVLLALRIRRAD